MDGARRGPTQKQTLGARDSEVVAFHSAQTPDSAEQVGRGLLRIPLAGKNIREEGAFAPR